MYFVLVYYFWPWFLKGTNHQPFKINICSSKNEPIYEILEKITGVRQNRYSWRTRKLDQYLYICKPASYLGTSQWLSFENWHIVPLTPVFINNLLMNSLWEKNQQNMSVVYDWISAIIILHACYFTYLSNLDARPTEILDVKKLVYINYII